MDRIDAMQAFVTVADLRGFAPAARKLGMSPSGVTISIMFSLPCFGSDAGKADLREADQPWSLSEAFLDDVGDFGECAAAIVEVRQGTRPQTVTEGTL